MTRGRIILADRNGLLHTSVEFNGDMYMNSMYGHGDDIVLQFILNSTWDQKSFYEYVEEFDKENFRYDQNYGYELIHTSQFHGEYDVTNNWSDYIYLLNYSGNNMKIITEDEEHMLPNDTIIIFQFQKIYKIIQRECPNTIQVNETQKQIAYDAIKLYLSMNIGKYTEIEYCLKELYGEITIDTENKHLRNLLYQAMRSIVFKGTDIEKKDLNHWLEPTCLEINANDIIELLNLIKVGSLELNPKQRFIYCTALRQYFYLINWSIGKFMGCFTDNQQVLELALIQEKLYIKRGWDKMEQESLQVTDMLRQFF